MNDFVSEFGVGGFEHIADESGEVWNTYGVRTQPTFVFINDDGAMESIASALGEDRLNEKLEELL